MAVPTYDELLAHYDMENPIMKRTFYDEHLRQFSLTLDTWERLAKFLGMSNSDIVNIKSQGDAEEQRLRMLECWKQRRGSMATYEAMVKALLQISRTDLAEKVIILKQSSRDIHKQETTTNNKTRSHIESGLTAPTSPAGSSGIEDAYSPAAMSFSSLPATPSQHTAQEVTSTLRELEEEFYNLVIYIEDTLEKNEVCMSTITRRFRMLPQSVKRQHQTDENYKEIRKSVLNSRTIKELFDNLTELKHWNYMTPDTLAHVIKDVKIDNIHKKIEKYKGKLMAFKANTKLGELIGISFPVPDYCMELTIEVQGWEDKTIEEVENRAVNIVRRAAYGSPHISLGWKGVFPGSIKVTFILTESVKLIPDKLFEDDGVVSTQIDSDIFHSKDYIKATSGNSEVPSRLWRSIAATPYQASGGDDVLLIAPDLLLPHPEAVARRPGQLTEEDKLKLQRQGLLPDHQEELAIIKARYEQIKECEIVEVKSGQLLLRKEVMESIRHLLNTTQNNGVTIWYIGAGRRNTGDWCFEDGFITFSNIAELYLRASHNFNGRILTIVSDCSYSGCWVRNCMEFLDQQGVQPCGHKAREKGMVIKMIASCKSNEIPTEYRFAVNGTENDKIAGMMGFWLSKQLIETQTTDGINSSLLNCNSKTIEEPCTLQRGYTWWKLRASDRIHLVHGKDRSRPVWHYVLVEDDEDTKKKFIDQMATGRVDVADYGQVLKSGWGKYPPNKIRDKIEKEFLISRNH